MPAIVQKSTNATNNIVCLSQACSMADDGFITVRARFLLRSVADLNYFVFDSTWPSGSSPRGLPNHQGGPYLVSRDFEYGNGLIFCNAVYATAANPVRVVYGTSKASRAFSGRIFIEQNGVAEPYNAKFDYTSTIGSARYTVIDDAVFDPNLTAFAKINSVTGISSTLLAKILKKNIAASEKTKTGRVTQVTDTLEVVFYSDN